MSETEKKLMVSVIIATYNSEKVLERTLRALRRQTYSQDKIEIIISDGMSSDRTREISQKYGCNIIDNPKIEQGNAKILGMQAAKGRFVLFVDSDEVLEDRNYITKTLTAFEAETDCYYAVCSGYKKPKNYPFLSGYISDFGDPFSFFVYRCPKDYRFLGRFLRNNYAIKSDQKDYFVFESDLARRFILIEGGCGGAMMDMQYFDEHFPECRSSISDLYHAYYKMCGHGETKTIFTKRNALLHYSSDTVSGYMKKLKWRICNNVHFREKGQEVYTGREKYYEGNPLKKYLFIPYGFSFIIPLAHSIPYSLSRRNPSYLLHAFLSFYTASQIIYQYVLHFLGITPAFVAYGSRNRIKR